MSRQDLSSLRLVPVPIKQEVAKQILRNTVKGAWRGISFFLLILIMVTAVGMPVVGPPLLLYYWLLHQGIGHDAASIIAMILVFGCLAACIGIMFANNEILNRFLGRWF